MTEMPTGIREFLRHHFRHYNAAALVDAAEGWLTHEAAGGQMFLTLAGALSTAELGLSLAELIRRNQVHAISCTGANLEEDVFNLVAHNHYERVPHYRELSADDEAALLARGLNRVTDTCIPEEQAMNTIERKLVARWAAASAAGERKLPHTFFYEMLRGADLRDAYQIDPKDSWLLAAAERNLPLFVPGWEDSSCGNMFVAACRRGDVSNMGTVKSGLEYMDALVDWYAATAAKSPIGFFQIGGGIAGDFPICVVPLINQDLDGHHAPVPLWQYFCQISDSTTSYGSYSGAVPNEKISWGKLDTASPKFIIESDATIVAPLVFQYLLAD